LSCRKVTEDFCRRVSAQGQHVNHGFTPRQLQHSAGYQWLVQDDSRPVQGTVTCNGEQVSFTAPGANEGEATGVRGVGGWSSQKRVCEGLD
jgi:hypothetical protein